MIRTDAEAWAAYPQDRWVYDRLELAALQGYPCGPAGIEPPGRPEEWEKLWWSKPIINLDGMAIGSGPYQHPVPPGHFWMPRFHGEHLSLDFARDEKGRWSCVLAVENIPLADGRPHMWVRWDAATPGLPPFPRILQSVDAPVVNVEFIGNQVIEAHLRPNPDFEGRDFRNLVVVWADDPGLEQIRSMRNFIAAPEDCDGQLKPARVGFVGAGHVPLVSRQNVPDVPRNAAKPGTEREISNGTCPTYPWEGEPE